MYPDRLAFLYPAEDLREPRQGIKWALDNGVFAAWEKKRPWSEEPFYRFLEKYAAWKPMWCVVPDWVGDRDRTLRLWEDHFPAIQAYGVPLAFAVQDGMTVADVPAEASVVFVGGTVSWKWRNLTVWTKNFPRVHVGRVNTRALLDQARAAGAESCDGTGWFRAPQRTRELEDYLSAESSRQEAMKL
jgi:hypothetical protein